MNLNLKHYTKNQIYLSKDKIKYLYSVATFHNFLVQENVIK